MGRYIVTGGTGHIGNVLLRELCKEKNEIIAIVLPNEDVSYIKDLNIKIVTGDITDRDFIMKIFKKGDIVFHLAGIIDIGTTPYETIYRVNVEGTKNIVDSAISNGVKKLVYTSSVHIIDPVEGVVLTEPEVFDDKNLVGNYAKTKVIATKYVLEESKKAGLDATVVYPSGVIGPYDYKVSELGQVVLDYMNYKLLAYVKGGYNFVDVRDVVNGLILAKDKGKSGEGYILSGHQITLKRMLQILNKNLGRTKLPPKIALWFVKMFAGLSNLYYKALHKKPVFSSYSLYTLNSNSNFSHEKASSELGYSVRPIEESLSDAIKWFKENKSDLLRGNKGNK